MMSYSSLIELHPIYANEVPADDPNPVQCVVHDGLADVLAMIEEAEQVYSNLSNVEETSPSTTGSPEAMAACEAGVPSTSIFALENQIIDDLLRERWDRQDEDAEPETPSPPSVISDHPDDDSNSSADSDIDESTPAPLSIPNDTVEQPLALIRAPKPLKSPTTTTPATTRRNRSLTASLITPPTLATPLFSTPLPAGPSKRRKRVHFHPSHSTRTFSIHSYSGDFCTATFSSTTPGSTNEIDSIRQQRVLSQAIKRSLGLPRKSGREKRRQKNCVPAIVAAQYGINIDGVSVTTTTGCPHESISEVYAHARRRVQGMRTTFLEALAPITSSPSSSSTENEISLNAHAHTVRHSQYIHRANLATAHALSELHNYLASCEYFGVPERMDSCPDAMDMAYFEVILARLGERLEELVLWYYSGEDVEGLTANYGAENVGVGVGKGNSSGNSSHMWEDVSE